MVLAYEHRRFRIARCCKATQHQISWWPARQNGVNVRVLPGKEGLDVSVTGRRVVHHLGDVKVGAKLFLLEDRNLTGAPLCGAGEGGRAVNGFAVWAQPFADLDQ